MISNCKECGCMCKNCGRHDNDIHLHVEIENLKQKLLERDNHIIRMETNFLNEPADSDEIMLLKDELHTLQDKFKRLSEAHKRVQRVNQGLEDKLLKLVDACETDKSALTRDVAVLSEKLAEANYTVKKLTDSNERYKNDVSVAIQFLQCKQSNFVAHKFDTLPPEIQAEVSTYMTHKKKPEERKPIEPKSIKVPIPTFPPTAMFYSVPKTPNLETKNEEEPTPTTPPVDVVSAAIMAKVLEERQRERMCVKHCDTCTCSKNLKLTDPSRYHDAGTQTEDTSSTQNCKTCSDLSQTNFQITKLARSTTDIANTKVPNFEHETYNNIVKVQPNNFLVEKSSSNASSLVDLDVNLSLDSSSVNLDAGSANVVNSISANVSSESLNLNGSSLAIDHSSKVNKKTEISQYQVLPISSEIVAPQNRHKARTVLNSSLGNAHVAQVETRNTLHSKSNVNVIHAHRNNDQRQIENIEEIVVAVRKSTDNNPKLKKTILNDVVPNQVNNLENTQDFEILDRSKYQEMEENVKRFLFKKTELWKEQASYLDDKQTPPDMQQTFSHTQTEI